MTRAAAMPAPPDHVPVVVTPASIHGSLPVVLHAVHLLQTVHRREVGLAIVGPIDDDSLRAALQSTIRRLRIANTWLVADATAVDTSRTARILAVAGGSADHDAGAVKSLRCDAAVVATVAAAASRDDASRRRRVTLPEDSGPERFAEAIAIVLDDVAARPL